MSAISLSGPGLVIVCLGTLVALASLAPSYLGSVPKQDHAKRDSKAVTLADSSSNSTSKKSKDGATVIYISLTKTAAISSVALTVIESLGEKVSASGSKVELLPYGFDTEQDKVRRTQALDQLEQLLLKHDVPRSRIQKTINKKAQGAPMGTGICLTIAG